MLSIFIAAIIWKFLFAKTSEQQQSLTNMTDPNNKDEVITIVDQAKPVFLNLTFGTAMGFCSGFALKKTGKAIAYLIGITFVALQLAVASGYIAVDWKKIEEDAEKRVDYTGDGKFNDEDIKKIWAQTKALLTHHVPSTGGFSLGFLYGLRF